MEEIEKKSGEYPTEKKGCDCLVSIQFIYGFLGAILVVFISTRIDIGVFLGYFIYNSFLSHIINRPKYITELGKRIIFPIPTTLGAFSGYKITGLLLEYIK